MPLPLSDDQSQAQLPVAPVQQQQVQPIIPAQQPNASLPPEPVTDTGLSGVADRIIGHLKDMGSSLAEAFKKPEKEVNPNDPVLFTAANGKIKITQGDIDKAINIALSAGPGATSPSLRPALKYGGKIFKAPVGGEHMDAIPKELQPEFTRQAMSGEDISNFDFGFLNHKGHFLSREDALKYAIDNGLLSEHDAKFGALTSTMDLAKPSSNFKDYVAALRDTDNTIYKAKDINQGHGDISKNYEGDTKRNISNILLSRKPDLQGFVDKAGNYLSRKEFDKKFGSSGAEDLKNKEIQDYIKEHGSLNR